MARGATSLLGMYRLQVPLAKAASGRVKNADDLDERLRLRLRVGPASEREISLVIQIEQSQLCVAFNKLFSSRSIRASTPATQCSVSTVSDSTRRHNTAQPELQAATSTRWHTGYRRRPKYTLAGASNMLAGLQKLLPWQPASEASDGDA